MEIRTTRFSSFDGLELKEASFRNHVFPAHFHDAYSIGIIEKGIERLSFDNKDILAHANTAVVINPYDIHANSFFDDDAWKYRALYINPDIMQYFQNKLGLFAGKMISFPKQLMDDALLYAMVLQMFETIDENTRQIKLYKLLEHLLLYHAAPMPETDVIQHKHEIAAATNYIGQHYTDKIILDELAAKYRMDKYQFIRAFKKQTGLTPVSYQLLQRINHSKQLIGVGLTVTDVALEVGFYDQSHFTHYFKKYIGVAPLSYKKGLLVA